MARDGSRMMAELATEAPTLPEDGLWRQELGQAEACRVAGDRKGEQRHYRAAVRAWRAARRSGAGRGLDA